MRMVLSASRAIKQCLFNIAGILSGRIKPSKKTFFDVLTSIHPTSSVGASPRGTLLLHRSISVGARCSIYCPQDAILRIGMLTTIFSDSIISGHVIIGRCCLLAKNVSIMSGSHKFSSRILIRRQDRLPDSRENLLDSHINIGDDCWIGSNAVILPGVQLGRGCVVGANAVVTKSFPSYSVIGGVPAKLLCRRGES